MIKRIFILFAIAQLTIMGYSQTPKWLLTAWLSSSAAVGLAASMFANGILEPRHVTILMPAFFLMGAQLQYMGRLLGVADVPKRYWPLLMSASILNAMFAMLLMHWFFA